MPLPLFLSHAHRDAELAKVIASTLERITVGQLSIWFSSDTTREGGLRPGDVWIDEIRTRLKESKAVIALLTPTSVQKPWLLFESGFGAALETCEIIPVCLGVSMDEVPFPLAMYQCSQLSDYESLKQLCSRLLARYEIQFDEELAAPLLRKSISEFTKHTEQRDLIPEDPPTLLEIRDQIQDHIDRRMVDFSYQIAARKEGRKERAISHTVSIALKFPNCNQTQHLDISESTTIDDVTDNIYFWLDGEVAAFTYLKDWILRETKSNRNLVIREFGNTIPAHIIFKPGTNWEAIPLDHHYTWEDSSDIERWR